MAFRPQATASAIQTEVLLDIAQDVFMARAWVADYFRLIIHDEFVLEVPERDVPLVPPVMFASMEQPWPQLEGLSIGCEGKMGRNLADRSSGNPDGLAVLER